MRSYTLGVDPYTAVRGMTSLNCVGAGARTIFAAGSLKRIAELGKKFTIIYGCSGGALNAAIYAQGEVDLLEWIWLNITNKDVREFNPIGIFNSCALYNYTPLQKTLLKHIDPVKLAKCPSGVKISLSSLSLPGGVYFDLKRLPADVHPVDVLLASASIPALVPPAKVGNSYYYDGGLCNNTGIEDAASRGVETITVLHPRYQGPIRIRTFMDSLEAITGLPMQSNYLNQMAALELMTGQKPNLVEIAPKQALPGSLFDFNFSGVDRKKIIQAGYDHAKEVLG